MRDKFRPGAHLAICMVLAAAAGCSAHAGLPELAKVHGQVTYQGKPVTAGTISFFPADGKESGGNRSAIGQIDTDGSFELTTFNTGDGAVLGQHRVIVVVPEPVDTTVPSDRIPSQNPADLEKARGSKPVIPKKYSDPERTPLRYTVQKGTNNFDIPLKD